MKALVTGGYFDDSGEGVVWELDFSSGSARTLVRWTPPPHLRVASKGFAGASRAADGTLYVAAHASVVRIDLAAAAVTGVLHQPCMNDLHHVAISGNRLFVSNTGLGSVDVFDLDGTFVGSHALLPAWVNARRMRGETPPDDWSAVLHAGWAGEAAPSWASSAPDDGYHSIAGTDAPFHRLKVRDHLHVNHIAFVENRVLATCFLNGCLLDLGRLEVLWREPGAFLHDGILHRDSLWLTAIDGTLIELDRRTMTERRRMNAFTTGHYGWCRGLAVSDEHLLVGLTEVRRGRLPRHRWADRAPEGSETSVLLLDRGNGRLVARVDLTDLARHSKLYSVLLSPETVS